MFFGQVKRVKRGLALALVCLGMTGLLACAPKQNERAAGGAPFLLIPFESRVREVRFRSADGTALAGQLDLPPRVERPPLVMIVHHSGPVDRDAYQYLAALLVPEGYAVFRFDKRGNGESGGTYGCCEEEDALAAYQAAVTQEGFDPERVFIVAQSVGTQIVARRFQEFQSIHPVRGVVLLSSLLEGKEILPIESPLFILVSDHEPNVRALTEDAVAAYRQKVGEGADYFIAPNTEHTLFDVSQGPIDWSDPRWPLRFSAEAAQNLLQWLEAHR